MNMSNVIVAYDGSDIADKALSLAAKMAAVNPTRIHIIYVVTPPTYVVEALNYEEILEGMYYYGKQIMEKAKDQMSQIDQDQIITGILEGRPSDMILQYANDHRCELIFMGSRGLGGLKELFLGSVSHDLVQRSKIPVFIVK